MSIFDEQISRKPNKYPWTTQFIEAMHRGFWTDKEDEILFDLISAWEVVEHIHPDHLEVFF